MSINSVLSTPTSLNILRTATGSVALISAPKAKHVLIFHYYLFILREDKVNILLL
jgi:hypothetical protein